MRKIPRTNLEYEEIYKTLRNLLRDNIRDYNTMRVTEALKTGKGLKKATNKEECKVRIPSLKGDGSSTTNRERILERCAEFYETLYEDTVHNIAKMETEEAPSPLTSEVERALSQMKSSKALEHQIVVEMIRAGSEKALRKIQELFDAVLRT